MKNQWLCLSFFMAFSLMACATSVSDPLIAQSPCNNQDMSTCPSTQASPLNQSMQHTLQIEVKTSASLAEELFTLPSLAAQTPKYLETQLQLPITLTANEQEELLKQGIDTHPLNKNTIGFAYAINEAHDLTAGKSFKFLLPARAQGKYIAFTRVIHGASEEPKYKPFLAQVIIISAVYETTLENVDKVVKLVLSPTEKTFKQTDPLPCPVNQSLNVEINNATLLETDTPCPLTEREQPST
jgi:hypothetical protein